VRKAGIGCEVFPEAKKIGKQLQYADKRGFSVALVAGDDELAAGTVQVKNLKTGESTPVSMAGDALEQELQKLLTAL
ncbi:MAG: histidine--tRNA ligase, partial [Planctomycetales bacterium]|nr:histidine--tRNA ligase [Planctomycetales bacterium]